MAGEDEVASPQGAQPDRPQAEPDAELVPVVEVEPSRPGRGLARVGPAVDAAFRDGQTDEWIVPDDPDPALEVRAAALPVPRAGSAVAAYTDDSDETLLRLPAVLEADSWDVTPPSSEHVNYQGRRRAKPVSRVRLMVAVILVVAAAAVAIPWTLTLGRSDTATKPAPTVARDSDSGLLVSDSASPDATSASALAPVGASPVRTSEQPPPSSSAPAPSAGPPPAVVLLSRGRPTATSALENASLAGPNAVDGNQTTRWGSAFADPQWISVDLGSVSTITRVRLTWEVAFGRSYQLQTSVDNANWTNVFTTTGGDGGTDDVTVTGTGRWLRVYGTQRGTEWGYSLWELEVFGTTP